MTTMVTGPDVTALPLAPRNPLPYRRRLAAARRFDTGLELLPESGGPVTRNVLGPRRIMPPLVFVSSPRGAHDVLARTDAFADFPTITPLTMIAAAPIRARVGQRVVD
jgi:hypothetical protein